MVIDDGGIIAVIRETWKFLYIIYFAIHTLSMLVQKSICEDVL